MDSMHRKGAAAGAAARLGLVTLIVPCAVLLLPGCVTTERGADTAVGAGVGAVGGAALTGGSPAGTIGGAVVGGVIGNQAGRN